MKSIRILFSILLLPAIMNIASAANYYWVNGTGNWSEFGTHWATTSGGALFHLQAPTANDDVFFDANSFSGPLQVVTIDIFNAECRNMDWTGATNNPTLAGANSITINGSLTFIPGMSCTMTGNLQLYTDNPATTLNFGGIDLPMMQIFFQFGSIGTWTLQSDINMTSINAMIMFNNGNLNTNGYTINTKNINIMGGTQGSWTLGSSTINCSGFMLMAMPPNFALNAGTSTINIVNGSGFFMGSGYTFYNINFDGLSSGNSQSINGNITFNILSFNNISTIRLPSDATTTVNDIQFNGSCSNIVLVSSNTSGSTANIFKTNGAVNEDYISVQDITVLGGGAFVSNNSIDLGNVHNWTINAPAGNTYYWVGGTGNWNDPTHWSLSSGGPQAGACAPTTSDDVIFDVNSFSAPGQMVSVDGNAFCHDMTWTGVSNNPDFDAFNAWGDNIYIGGDFILDANMTLSFNGTYNFVTSDPAQFIATQNKILAGPVYFSGSGGWGLVQGLQCTSVTFNQGSLNTNNQNIITGSFYSNTNLTRNINLGASNVQLTSAWQIQDNTNLTLNAATANIGFTGNATFQGGFQNYLNVGFGANANIYHSNTFGNLAFNAGTSVSFEAGSIQTITIGINATGTCGSYIDLTSMTEGTQAKIVKAIGAVNVSYCRLKDMNASGGAAFTAANSTDMGNNTGWTITSPATTTYYWIAGTGNWNETIHWSTSSGGPAGTCIPSWSDNVVFDANSGLAAKTVTVNVNSGCNNFSWTVNAGTLVGTSADLYIGGNFSLIAGMTMNYGSINNSLIFNSNNPGNTINFAGKNILSNIEFNGSGSWSLLGAMSCTRSVYLHKGNLNLNNFAMSVSSFYSQTAEIRQLSLGNQIHTISGGWYLQNGTNFTLVAGTSTLNMAGTYFYGGDQTYNIVNLSTGGFSYVFGNNTFTTLNIPNSKNVSLEGGKTQTMTNLTLLSGTDCSNFNNLYSDNPGTPASIAKAGVGVLLNFMNISDVTSTGAAVLTANNSIGIGNVTGWVINPPPAAAHYWVGGTGSWTDPLHWSAASGGPGGLCVPTSLDDVIFDANSFPNPDTVTLNTTGYCKSMNWTGAGFIPLFEINGNLNVNGSLTFIPAMNIYTFSSIKFTSSLPANTITSAGKIFYYIYFNGTGAYTLQDDLSFSYIYFNNGILNTNNFALNGGNNGTFTSNSTSTRTLNLGSSTVQVTNWDISDGANMTLNAGTSLIILNNNPWQFRGGDMTYNNVNINPGSFGGYTTIYGSNSFNTLKFFPGCDIRFESGKTQTTAYLDAVGDPGNLISLSSSAAGAFSSISQVTQPFCGDYLEIKDIHVAGTTFYAGDNSVNNGGNLGWTWSGMTVIDQYPASMCEDVVGGGTVAGIDLTSYNAAIDGGLGYTHTWYSDALLTVLVPVPTNVTVSDGLTFYDLVDNGTCTEVAQIVFTVTTKPVLTLVPTNVSCFGGNNGAVDLSVSAGTAPLTFLWSNTETTEDISGLIIGNYLVTVTDANGCSNTGSVLITQPTQITLSTVITDVSCFGGGDGEIDLTVVGGVGPYTYLWTGGATTEDLSGLAALTYDVTVTDANLCTATGSATVNQPAAALSVSGIITNILCNSMCTGAIDVTASGGTPAYLYSWNTGSIVADQTGLCAGAYGLTVTDSHGCTATYSPVVTEPPALTYTQSQTDVLIYGQCTGTATVNPSGGTGVPTYLWDDPSTQTTQTAIGLCAGIYNCTITDANSCTVVAIFTITQSPQLTATITKNDPSCFGQCNGTITTTPSGGVAPYTYLWTGGLSGCCPVNVCDGTYDITITDAVGATYTNSVVLTEPTLLSISSTVTHITCNGLCNGAIAITVSGGTVPYSYSWTGPASYASSSEDISALCAGTYDLTVTDANSCTVTSSLVVNQPALLTAAITNTNVTCNGSCDGTVSITPSGGTLPYTYSWTGPGAYTSSAEDISGLCPGSYNVTITDGNNCTFTASKIITEPAILVYSETHIDPLCNGDCDGEITVTPSGGTGPYTMIWSNAYVGFNNTSLCTGNYSGTITDDNGCTATASITLTEPSAISVTETHTNVICNGQCNGTIDITVSGGTSPYNYLWVGPATFTSTDEDLTGLCAGTYNLSISDDNGCVYSTSIQITEPLPWNVTETHTNVNCNGVCSGSIDITVSGATSPYTYFWEYPSMFTSTDEDITDLCAGTYNLTVTDDVSCTYFTSITITEPVLLEITSQTSTDITCNGLNDGTVTIIAAGGIAPLQYNIGAGDQIAGSFTGLSAGLYTVTVTDGNSCTALSNTYTITNPTALSIVSETSTNVTCYLSSDGEITIVAAGGTIPLTYDIGVGAQPNGIFGGLPPADYTVTVTDDHGCTISSSIITISQPSELIIDSETSTDLTCYNGSNGTITVTASGGTGTLTYDLGEGGQTTGDFTGLATGTYQVTVTDANSCTVTSGTLTLSEPTELTLSETHTDVTTCGASDGTITLTVSGGTPGYSFYWEGPTGFTATTQDLSGLLGGIYNVTVTDNNLCTGTLTVVINETGAPTVTAVVTNNMCYGNCNGTITTTTSGGTSPYTYNWSNGQTTENISGLCAGVFDLTVTDDTGCKVYLSEEITQPDIISATTDVTDETCHSSCDGTITVTASGGTAPFTFDIGTGSQASNTFSGLCPGSYIVTVTDGSGCTATATADIEAYSLTLSFNSTDLTCNGTCNGSSEVVVNGTTGPYTYLWSSSDVTSIITNLCAGDYDITVSDVSGCTTTGSTTISEPLPWDVTNSYSDISCFGACSGSIDLTVSGATPPYSYLWEGPAAFTSTDEDLTGLCAGTYNLTITDDVSCTYLLTINITEPVLLEITSEASTDITCNGMNDGTVTIIAAGGTSPLLYNIGAGDQATGDFTGLSAGDYIVTVTDDNGCTAVSNTLTMTDPAPIVIVSENYTGITCNGTDDGTITVIAAGGTPALMYDLGTGSQANGLFTGLSEGIYVVTITDSHSCSVTSSLLTIDEPDAISIGTESSTDLTCFNGNNGTITVTASGGTGALLYDIGAGGQATGDFTGLAAGTYMVTISDANGCAVTSVSFTLLEPAQLVISETHTDITTCGASDGTITLTVAGGTPSYTFAWTGPNSFTSTLQDLTGLESGFYDLTVTDNNLCATTLSLIINETGAPTLSATVVDNLCYGSCLGEINTVTSGGTAPYTYNWSNGMTADTITGLCAGIIDLTVTDDAGCHAYLTEEILQPDSIEVTLVTTDETCHSSCDGTITVDATGGTLPFTFDIGMGAQPGNVFTGLCPGMYFITLTDNNGCTATESATINAYSITVSATTTNISCNGLCDGAISLSVTGGAAPYTYLWDGSQTTSDITNLCAGSYYVTITDNSGCTTENIFTLTEPTPLVALMDSTDDYGTGDGTATAIVSGGIPPYTFIWSAAGTDSTITALTAGMYYVTISDQNGCMIIDSVEVLLNVGITFNSGNSVISIYPNPFHSVLNVKIEKLSEEVIISVLDVSGRSVVTEKILPGNAIHNIIDMEDQAEGMYFIQITGANINHKEKLILR